MQIETLNFTASCKLMLFGEYLVLEGAKSLAFPLKYGQNLQVEPATEIIWQSHSPEGIWFEASFTADLKLIDTNNQEVAETLLKLFQSIANKNPSLNLLNSYKAVADFNLNWGLGSSSTLISLLSQWSGVDPFYLLNQSFGGSGYDIACATASKPIIFQKEDSKNTWHEVTLSENITKYLLFVYLGKKQNSRNEIKRFQSAEVTRGDIEKMNNIVDKSQICNSIDNFEQLLNKSEELLSPIIGKQQLKEHIFVDYEYSIKSLGAWGGDFFLATFRDLDAAKKYFSNKGLTTMFTYNEMVK